MNASGIYNEKFKLKFIHDQFPKLSDDQSFDELEDNYSRKRLKYMLNAFSIIAPVESKYKTDFIFFTVKQAEEAEKALSDFALYNYIVELYIPIYDKYLGWAVENDFIAGSVKTKHLFGNPQNLIARITSSRHENESTIEKMRNTHVSSYESFVNYCNVFFSQERYVMQRCIAYLTWIGIPRIDIFRLKRSDFDPQARTITGIPIKYNEAYDAIKDCCLSSGYSLTRKGKSASSVEKYYEYEDTPYLIRNTVTGTTIERDTDPRLSDDTIFTVISRNYQSLVTIENKIAKTLPSEEPMYNVRLSFKTIVDSRNYSRLYKYMQEHPDTDVESEWEMIYSFIKTSDDEQEMEYSKKNAPSRYRNFKVRFNDYLLWKNTFYPEQA